MAEKEADYIGHRERVRKKFLANNGKGMADYELLELLLMMAIPRRDVKPIAKELLRKFCSFANVVNALTNKLMEINYIKETSAVLLKSVAAAVQKICWENLANDDKPVLINIDTLVDYCRSSLAYSDVKELMIMYLDASLKLVDTEVLQKGSLTGVAVAPREIVQHALDKNVPNIIMVHNHPSGNVRPSENDCVLTRKIAQACELMGLKLQEHIIISRNGYFSFREKGLIS